MKRAYAFGLAASATFGLAQGFLTNDVRFGLSGFFLGLSGMLVFAAIQAGFDNKQ